MSEGEPDTTAPPEPGDAAAGASAPEEAARPRSVPPPRPSAVPAPRVTLDPLDPGSEYQLGSDARGKAANAALRAITRAARSYTIYDAGNAAVRGFIEEMLEAVEHYVSQHGDLALEIGPEEMLLDGERVYLERDRERSLAGKLFRDGIRALTIERDVDWRELVGLLEVLTVRFVGVRQLEDDLVTLLAKAGLTHIRVRALDGMVSFDEDEDAPEDEGLPTVFDLPEPVVSARASVRGRRRPGSVTRSTRGSRTGPPPPAFALPRPEQLAALHDELSLERTTPNTLVLFGVVLDDAAGSDEPARPGELVTFARDLREHLLTEGDLETLAAIDARIVAYGAERPAAGEALAGWRRELASRPFLERVLPMLSRPGAPAALAAMISRPPSDPLPALLDLFETERPEAELRMITAFLELAAHTRGAEIAERCRTRRGALAAQLLHVLVGASPAHAKELLGELVRGGDPEVQLEFLALLERLSRGTDVRAYLSLLLSASDESVRLRALRAIVALAERGASPVVVGFAERRAAERASPPELAAAAEALVALDPARGLEAFERWCARRGWMERLLGRPWPLAVAATAGLVRCADPRADALLAHVAAAGPKDAREAAQAAITRRAALPPEQRLGAAPRPPSGPGSPTP